jgi:hypothetical protein
MPRARSAYSAPSPPDFDTAIPEDPRPRSPPARAGISARTEPRRRAFHASYFILLTSHLCDLAHTRAVTPVNAGGAGAA